MLMLRWFVFVLVTVWCSFSTALACRSPDSITTPFYDDIPTGADAQAIVEVTVMGLTTSARYPRRGYSVAWAKIIKVHRGPLKKYDTIKIVTGSSSCDIPLAVGQRGIVLGELDRDPEAVFELIAISETLGVRRNRTSTKK